MPPAAFVSLAAAHTRMGVLSLWRRTELTRGIDVYEVKLGDEYLMSSLFTVAEEALAHLGLAACDGDGLRVVIGGLGLGYTARAALEDARVVELIVIDALEDVIDWHRRELLPDVTGLADDSRVQLVTADFFALAREGRFGIEHLDAVLLDVDHSTTHHLDASHADLYSPDGLALLAAQLRPGGVFALWSDDPPHAGFLAALESCFVDIDAHVIEFANFLTGGTSTNTVYVARTGPRAAIDVTAARS